MKRSPVHPIRSHRRGVATLWLILALPAVLTLLVVVVEVGNLWTARAELESALEAAALAGAQEWCDSGNIVAARQRAVEMANGNSLAGVYLVISNNDDGGGGQINRNASATGNLILGAVTGPSPANFDATQAPDCGAAPARDFGVRAQATVEVETICNSVFGLALPITLPITARSDAVCRCGGTAQLIRVGNYTGP